MSIKIDNLERALTALESGLDRYQDDVFMDGLDKVTQNLIMSGVIPHFEFTYELCRILIERWLRENYGTDFVGVSRRDVYRYAGEYDLIDGVERWFRYHEERNRSSHRYDEQLLAMLDETVPQFIVDARALLATLTKHDV